MDTHYESPDPSSLSRFEEPPEFQLDYDILNTSYLDAFDFTSDFTIIGDMDSTPDGWPDMNFFPDLNLPPYTGLSPDVAFPPQMDLPTDMDISQSTGNFWDAPSYSGSTSSVEFPPVLKYPCAHCPRSFRREGDRRKHLRIHTRPVQCPVPGCNASFAQQRDSDRHMESKHKLAATKTDSTACWTCGRSFARKDALKRHFARVHKLHVSFRSKPGSASTTAFSDKSGTSPDSILSDR